MTLKHQYNSSGNEHRIVELDFAGFLKTGGDWVRYDKIATFNTSTGITYMAVTSHHNGIPGIQPDVIYQLSQTEFKSETRIVRVSAMTRL